MENQALVIALIGVLGIGAQWLAWRTGWPGIALMLLAGIIAGPVTGLIVPERDFGDLVKPVISIAVAVILFEGGLSLNFRELRHGEGSGDAVLRLCSLGIPIGWALGAIACYYVAGLVWPVAILFAGILVVTGPTVVQPLLRQSDVSARPRAILKWEAIVNDPFGALCAVVTYEYLRQSALGATFGAVLISLMAAAVVAGLIGYGMARAVAWAFPRGYVPEYLKAPILLIAVIGTYVLSDLIQHETGLLAVTVMGLALANMRVTGLRMIRPFKENITVLLVSGVFILLAASLNIEVLQRFELRFVAFLLALLFLVRPATVLLSLAFSRVPWRERLFVAWIAPRGVVAIAITGLFALRLDELGYSDGGTLVSLSFAVVVATIVAHGFSIKPVARWLGVMSHSKRGLLIVGATSWSEALAVQLRELDMPVTVIDTSWQRLAPIRQQGITTVHGEVLYEAVEGALDLNQFQLLVATTDNEAYNTLVCSELAPELGHDAVYQLGTAGDDRERLPDLLRGHSLFGSGLSAEELIAREDAGWTFRKTRLTEHFDAEAMAADLPDGGEMLLLVRNSGTLRFFTHESQPNPLPGDVVISFVPPAKTADRAQARMGPDSEGMAGEGI